MKIITVYILMGISFLLNYNVCFSQSKKIDSLIHLIQFGKDDTNKVNILNDLSYEGYKNYDFEAEMNYAKKALALAKKINWKKGTADAYRNLGGAFEDFGNYEMAIKNYLLGLKIYQKLKFKKGIANSYNNLGLVYKNQGNYTGAMRFFKETLKIEKSRKSKIDIAKAYLNIGLLYYSQGNYAPSQKNYYYALKLFEELDDKKGIANVYNNLGGIYSAQFEYSKALNQYKKSLKIMKVLCDKSGLLRIYNNAGLIYKNQGKYKESFEYLNLALKIEIELGDKNLIASSYINMGNLFCIQKNYSEALKNYFVAKKLMMELGNLAGIANCNLNTGTVYTFMHKPIEGKKQLMDALLLSKKLSVKDIIKNCYYGLYRSDSALNNNKSALENFKLYIIYCDSLVNEENTKKTVQTAMQYDFDKKQTADSIKTAEKTIQEKLKHNQEIKQQKIYTYGGIAGFILMLIVAVISFRAFKQKQKSNHIILEQKLLVEEKQNEILDSIRYAKRIQLALLPSKKYISRILNKK